MPFTSYSDLLSTIEGWLNRQDLATVVPDFVALAEDDIRRKVRTGPILTATVSVGTTGAAGLPADYLSPVGVSGPAGVVRIVPYSTMLEVRAAVQGGPIQCVAIDLVGSGSVLYAAPLPAASEDLTVRYRGGIPPIAVFGTNWVLQRFPSAYLYGALIHSAPYLRDDDRITMWSALYRETLGEIRAAMEREEYGTAPLVAVLKNGVI